MRGTEVGDRVGFEDGAIGLKGLKQDSYKMSTNVLMGG